MAVRGVSWWGVISSAAAPVLLIGGWTVAAGLQPRSFNPVADTISALAAEDATDRWVMTFALLGLGACYITTALALRPAAAPGRLILTIGGAATILVAANPEPAGSGSLPHTAWAATAFIAMAAWPAASLGRGPSVPYGLRSAVCVSATAMMLGLLVWFYAELRTGGRHLGLAERVLAGVEAAWPLAVILNCYRSRSRARTPIAGPADAGR
ncbi:MAG: DUF998 domain-containing protein [Streptosporangiaceae bacterium]